MRLVKTYVDINRLVIWGDPMEGEEKRPRMIFGFRDGNPRISVYFGTRGVIYFPSDVPTMTYICTILKEIAEGPNGAKQIIQSLRTKYEDNKPTNQKDLTSTLYIGKTSEGIVYLSVISEGKPKIIFNIKPSEWHTFRDENKQDIPVSVISSKLAIGIANTVLNIVNTILLKYTEEEYNTTRKVGEIKTPTGFVADTKPKTTEVGGAMITDIESLDL